MRQGAQVRSNDGDTGMAHHQRLPYVRRLLESGRANGRSTGLTASRDRNWRRVPKINILPSKRATPPATSLIRLALLVVLLVEAFFIQQWYKGAIDSSEQIEKKTIAVESAALQLDSERQAVASLQRQLSELQSQRNVLEEEFREVTSGQIDWHVVLGELIAVETQGSRILRIITSPSGEITLEGEATGPDALGTLRTQLTSVADILTLQSMETEPGGNPPTFTVIFQVRQ